MRRYWRGEQCPGMGKILAWPILFTACMSIRASIVRRLQAFARAIRINKEMNSGGIIMNETHDGNGLKANITGLYNRVAATYGQVGPERFAYAGRHLVEHMGISDGARVLDVAVGRGANLFPAAEKVGPRGQVIGIDLAENMVQETKAEIERRNISHATVLQMDA